MLQDGGMHTLFIGNNKIKSWDEVSKLAQCPEICNVLLVGNVIYNKDTQDDSWPMVIKRVPQLTTLDDNQVTSELRQRADALD